MKNRFISSLLIAIVFTFFPSIVMSHPGHDHSNWLTSHFVHGAGVSIALITFIVILVKAKLTKSNLIDSE